MPDDQAVALQNRNVAVTNTFMADLETYTRYLEDALPSHMPVARFKRTIVWAVGQNPDLLYANRRSLFGACQRCAVDGLWPDGREAALVVHNTKVTQRDPQTGTKVEKYMDLVQYYPMIAGIRKRLRNSGEVLSSVAEAVFEKDTFHYSLGDNAYIEHKPPKLGEPRGEVVGAWAIITLAGGEKIRDVMDRDAIERTRAQSRAPGSLMWSKFYAEGAKKTVLRRAAKQAPFAADLERLFNRDDEHPTHPDDPGPLPEIIEHQPEPEPDIEIAGNRQQPPETTGPQYAVVDLDGVESIFTSPGTAYQAMRVLLADAEKRGERFHEGWWESNQPCIELMAATGAGQAVADLAEEYDRGRQRLREAAQAREAPAATPVAPQPEQPTGEAARPANMAIPMVMSQGKPNHRTWAMAMFIPKLRRQKDPRDLGFLLGDNEEHLEAARRELTKNDVADLNAAIEAQWKAVDQGR